MIVLLCQNCCSASFGKVFADKGYVSQKLAKQLLETAGIQLITKLKRNMKQRLMPLCHRLLLRKRAIIETIIDQLKNISQIEHSRHRSPVNCFVNIRPLAKVVAGVRWGMKLCDR